MGDNSALTPVVLRCPGELDAGYWFSFLRLVPHALSLQHWILDARCWKLDARCWILDRGYRAGLTSGYL
ncbi:MAG: hypothetical protein KJ573_16470 [Proteobacteria bacterium]|nr:hypothetical protein [Pseudomonadota bacterium]